MIAQREVPALYQEFLIRQVSEYKSMIYVGDRVATREGLEGSVIMAESEEADVPGLDDLWYLVDINGARCYKQRLELKRISQTEENRILEAELRAYVEMDAST